MTAPRSALRTLADLVANYLFPEPPAGFYAPDPDWSSRHECAHVDLDCDVGTFGLLPEALVRQWRWRGAVEWEPEGGTCDHPQGTWLTPNGPRSQALRSLDPCVTLARWAEFLAPVPKVSR